MTERVEEYLSLGSRVRRRRKALDLTQATLADRVGCAEVTIRKIETDTMRPSRIMAERLAHCLDLAKDEQTVFLQVAYGDCSEERLPTPLISIESPPLASTSGQPQEELFPLDILPHHAPLPHGSRMPLRRNPLFVGRDANLRQVAQALNVGGAAAIGHVEIAATTGLGGIGKTQLACEFVHRYGQFFAGGVFWLSFADSSAIAAEFAACGGVGGMQLSPEFGALSLDEQVKLVLGEWAKSLPRLLVFDNCDEHTLLEQWRPKHGGSHVLVTSRHHHWDPALGVQPIPLGVLRRDDSLALLRSFRPDLPVANTDLAAIAEVLGDLPLALHLAGSFLAKYRHALTPAQYLERVCAPTILDDRSLQAAGVSPTQHVQHMACTFEQSYERLDHSDPIDALAHTLLAHAACFAPGESLPRWLLLETLELPDADVERALIAEDALTRLIDLGLLDTDATGSLYLHRLLVAFVLTLTQHPDPNLGLESSYCREGQMPKKGFTEEQIVYALRQAEAGTPVLEVCRKLGVTEQTFYRWKRKFAGLGMAELRKLRQLEEENRKLKQLVADLTLDKHMLQDVLQKKF